jgi:hypothetical protein
MYNILNSITHSVVFYAPVIGVRATGTKFSKVQSMQHQISLLLNKFSDLELIMYHEANPY